MKESGDAFCKAAEMALKAQEKLDAGQRFYDASKSYKLSNPECKPAHELCILSQLAARRFGR